jgi:hypothetical protein
MHSLFPIFLRMCRLSCVNMRCAYVFHRRALALVCLAMGRRVRIPPLSSSTFWREWLDAIKDQMISSLGACLCCGAAMLVSLYSVLESVPGPRDALVVPRDVHMCCSALRASG